MQLSHMSSIYEMSRTIWYPQLFHIPRPWTSWISSAQYRMPVSYKSDICELSRTIWCHQLIHVPRPLRSWISSARYRMPVSCVSLESWINWQYFSKVSLLVVLCREYSGERSVENFELRTTKLTHTFCTVNLVESGLLRKLCPSTKLSSIWYTTIWYTINRVHCISIVSMSLCCHELNYTTTLTQV